MTTKLKECRYGPRSGSGIRSGRTKNRGFEKKISQRKQRKEKKKKRKKKKRMDFGLSWYSTGALKAVQDLVIRAEVRSVLDSVVNQVIDDATAGIYDDLLFATP